MTPKYISIKIHFTISCKILQLQKKKKKLYSLIFDLSKTFLMTSWAQLIASSCGKLWSSLGEISRVYLMLASK